LSFFIFIFEDLLTAVFGGVNCSVLYGITMSPITRLLSSNGISLDNPLCTFTDSSCNDDIDTGRSSGCFMIFYMGLVVEHSSNMPDTMALSRAEAEYNEAYLACMATAT
jgi:hypothetical protein